MSELARPFDMSLPAISKHLSLLEDAHIIKKVKEGRTFICQINPDGLKGAAGWMDTYRSLWERQLDSLKSYLQNQEAEPH